MHEYSFAKKSDKTQQHQKPFQILGWQENLIERKWSEVIATLILLQSAIYIIVEMQLSVSCCLFGFYIGPRSFLQNRLSRWEVSLFRNLFETLSHYSMWDLDFFQYTPSHTTLLGLVCGYRRWVAQSIGSDAKSNEIKWETRGFVSKTKVAQS